jgi:hypothetical protein
LFRSNNLLSSRQVVYQIEEAVMVYKSILGAACTCLAVVSFSADASLLGRLADTPGGTDYQAYYDDVADLTWLDASNVAVSMVGAVEWISGLDVAGVTGWRLPENFARVDASCSNTDTNNDLNHYSDGYGCTGSEMGNLFYNVLGNTAGSLSNNGPFTFAIPTNNGYGNGFWTSTKYGFWSTYYSNYTFDMNTGETSYSSTADSLAAWALKSGDVNAVPVPMPAAIWLFASGFVGH